MQYRAIKNRCTIRRLRTVPRARTRDLWRAYVLLSSIYCTCTSCTHISFPVISIDGRVRKYSNAGYSSMGGALSCSVTRSRFHARQLNEDWYKERGRGKIERGRGKITGRKERKKKIQLHLWDISIANYTLK